MNKTMMIQLLSIIADYPAPYVVLVQCYDPSIERIGTWYDKAAEVLTSIEETATPRAAKFLLGGIYREPGTLYSDF